MEDSLFHKLEWPYPIKWDEKKENGKKERDKGKKLYILKRNNRIKTT